MRASVVMILAGGAVWGQWLHHPDAGLPRLSDGRPNINAPVTRAADGKPDLAGIWRAESDPNGVRGGVENGIPPKYFVSIAGGLNPGKLPMKPWAAELFGKRMAGLGKDHPTSACKPLGTPARDAFPMPFKIVQTPRLILLLYEQDTVFRQVFMDGRGLPMDPQPSWLGYSVGRWEGDTLVVETIGLQDQGWLDAMGHPHSDALRMEERFRRVDLGRMEIAVTFHDAKAYTAPVGFTQVHELLPDTELLEYFCSENEKDQVHMVGR